MCTYEHVFFRFVRPDLIAYSICLCVLSVYTHSKMLAASSNKTNTIFTSLSVGGERTRVGGADADHNKLHAARTRRRVGATLAWLCALMVNRPQSVCLSGCEQVWIDKKNAECWNETGFGRATYARYYILCYYNICYTHIFVNTSSSNAPHSSLVHKLYTFEV